MVTTYTVIASCTYRNEVRRYDVEASSTEQARQMAADLYGHAPGIGVDPADVATQVIT